jgi:hypothetical protein
LFVSPDPRHPRQLCFTFALSFTSSLSHSLGSPVPLHYRLLLRFFPLFFLRTYRYLLPVLKFARPEQLLGRVLGGPNAPPSFLI